MGFIWGGCLVSGREKQSGDVGMNVGKVTTPYICVYGKRAGILLNILVSVY